MRTRYTVTRCPGCGRRLGVNGVDIHRLSPGAPAPESRQRLVLAVAGGSSDPAPSEGQQQCPPSVAGLRKASDRRTRPVGVRFWEKVDTTGGLDACWPWTGTQHEGYGQIWVTPRMVKAHRMAWTLTHGPIADGLFVLHRCDNPSCCNPTHLFVGTHTENMADMAAKGRGRKPLTTCQNGHPLSGSNVRRDPHGRHCRTCERAGHRRRRLARSPLTSVQAASPQPSVVRGSTD